MLGSLGAFWLAFCSKHFNHSECAKPAFAMGEIILKDWPWLNKIYSHTIGMSLFDYYTFEYILMGHSWPLFVYFNFYDIKYKFCKEIIWPSSIQNVLGFELTISRSWEITTRPWGLHACLQTGNISYFQHKGVWANTCKWVSQKI